MQLLTTQKESHSLLSEIVSTFNKPKIQTKNFTKVNFLVDHWVPRTPIKSSKQKHRKTEQKQNEHKRADQHLCIHSTYTSMIQGILVLSTTSTHPQRTNKINV